MFVARLAFRGIYFPQMRSQQWLLLLWRNRRTMLSLCREAFRGARHVEQVHEDASAARPAREL